MSVPNTHLQNSMSIVTIPSAYEMRIYSHGLNTLTGLQILPLMSPGRTDSAVLALVGRWGSGKTSMINFVKIRIDEAESFKIVDFNPWMVSDLPSVLTDFLALRVNMG